MDLNGNIINIMIVYIGWPVLVIGSIYIFITGRGVYNQVKAGLVGGVVKVLVVSMVIQMYSLGIIATVLMFVKEELTIPVVLPIFIVWFVTFIWALKEINHAKEEIKKITEGG